MKKLKKGKSKTGRVYPVAVKLNQVVPAGAGPHKFFFRDAPPNATHVVIPDCYVLSSPPYKGLTAEIILVNDYYIGDFDLAVDIPDGTYLEVYNYKSKK